MRSIRKFAYGAALALSVLCVQPTPAVAEDAHGVFTLSHEVHWQNCILTPGEYAFSVKGGGFPTVVTLRGINDTATDAMLLVSNVATPKPNAQSKLTLVSRHGQSFVSEMDLPEYDMTLSFMVPPDSGSK